MRIAFRWIAVAALLAASCSSGGAGSNDSIPAQLIPPEITIQQISRQAVAAEHIATPTSVRFQVIVANKSAEPIKLERIQLESLGEGAYYLRPTTQSIGLAVAPEHFETAEFWMPVDTANTIIGANGPVTLRAIAYFDSPVGKFRQVSVQQVNTNARTRPGPG